MDYRLMVRQTAAFRLFKSAHVGLPLWADFSGS